MKIRKILIAVIATTLVSAFYSVNVFACGESLYRVGKGISYRAYSAPLPGNLLYFIDSDVALKRASQLKKSGHKVQLVKSIEDFSAELAKGGYDLVIAPFSEIPETTNAQDPASRTVYLPVAVDKAEKQLANKSHGRAIVAQDGIKDYLKSIHRVMKNKT